MTKIFKTFICIISLILGASAGAIYVTYTTLPLTEELIIGENLYLSFKGGKGWLFFWYSVGEQPKCSLNALPKWLCVA